MNNLIQHASAAQARASDPVASVFVSANAGTGKTKLLTDRVLRLLLAGAPADSILCVTYTRAAAAEMRNRINKRLGDWTIISAQKLADDLKDMGIDTPRQDMLQRARSLFAEILDNDNGPRVETVHSFCQTILHRFPIEAGIAPHARLADDDEQARLKLLARNGIMASADAELMAAVQIIAATANEDRADKILQAFLDRETRLADPNIISKIIRHFEDALHIGDADDAESQKRVTVARIDDDALRMVAAALQASDVDRHIRRGALMDVWLAQTPDDRIQKLSFLVDALFSEKGALAERSLSNAGIRKALPDAVAIQQAVIDCIQPLLCGEKAQICKQMTVALYRYGVAFWREYERLKAVRGVLDYNDLINRTNQLLGQSDAAQWVAWKLDNGIQHILIDEAQDTSPQQWQLLRRLMDDFFAGEGADYHGSQRRTDAAQNLPDRSMFAVGDFKQSIYSFQGADPRVMGDNRMSLAKRAAEAEKEFRDVALSVSFRSSQPILQLVNALIPERSGIEDFTPHQVARDDLDGFVEIWPVVSGDAEGTPDQMFGAPVMASANAAETKAAQQLADKLKAWIGSKTLSSGKTVGAGDILILLRKRGAFFEQILKALQHNGIPVAGADRMRLEEQIEIQDLLALGDVMMLPEDDLQLASVLKSPLCGLDDDDLYRLAYGRGDASLYAALMAHRGGDDKFGAVADQMAQWRMVADGESVFGFYSYVLVNGGRQNFIRRLGHAVHESLDHFLGLAQSMALGDGMSLLQFLASIRGSGGDIKRDMDSAGSGEVRVMTIHGAKGLEAPIVILPDMLKSRSIPQLTGSDSDGRAVYWFPPGAAFQPQFILDAKAASRDLEQQEANRLLYVALTRAREGLVVAGWEKPHGVRVLDGSDYALIKSALATLPGVEETDDGHMRLEIAATRITEATEADRAALPPHRAVVSTDSDWIARPAPIDAPTGRPLRPSQPGLDHAPSTLAPRQDAGTRRRGLAYGRIAHRLLEILPSVPETRWHAVAQPILRQDDALSESVKADILQRVVKVMSMPELAPLFGQGALAEVPINGRINGIGVAGQIDRLYVGDDRIILADFKTGQRPHGAAPNSYIEQMALYDALLSQIYQGRDSVCWLVWTHSQFIEDITVDQRQQALQRLFANRQGK